MSTTVTLAKQFEASALQTGEIAKTATELAASAPPAKTDITTEIAAVATQLSDLSTRIASTLRASLHRTKKAA